MPPGLLLANQGDVSGPSCKFTITSYDMYVIYIDLQDKENELIY